MEPVPIVLMKDRRRAMISIDKIKVINSRTRDEEQFALNVQSIEAVGQIKDIRVNDKFLARTGFYELICGEGRLIAQKRLGQNEIRAEIVTCTRKRAYLESLVENLRSRTWSEALLTRSRRSSPTLPSGRENHWRCRPRSGRAGRRCSGLPSSWSTRADTSCSTAAAG